jgi:hypothetical protein
MQLRNALSLGCKDGPRPERFCLFPRSVKAVRGKAQHQAPTGTLSGSSANLFEPYQTLPRKPASEGSAAPPAIRPEQDS